MSAAEEEIPGTPSWLDECLAKMADDCNVYCQGFFWDGAILTNVRPGQFVAATECRRHLETLGTKWLEGRMDKCMADRLRPGPYLYLDGTLKPVFSLHDSTRGAFLASLVP